MDEFVKRALKTRAVFMLSFVVIAMMAALVTHAGAMDPTSQITQGQYCHWWCNEYGQCFWVCDPW